MYLEVAEDYAVIANQALEAVQVKDTNRSGTVTLNTACVRDAVTHFVELQKHDLSTEVHFRFLTTSEIGTERGVSAVFDNQPGLLYWRACAAGADVEPLRQALEGPQFSTTVRKFCRARDDSALRRDLIQRISWDCGRPDFSTLRQELDDRLVVLCRECFQIPEPESSTLPDVLLSVVLRRAILDSESERVLTRADLYRTIDGATRVSVPRSWVGRVESTVAEMNPANRSDPGRPELSRFVSGWFIDTRTLPTHPKSIPRPDLESMVDDALRRNNVCILHSASGVGKSTVARSVTTRSSENVFLVSFRDLSPDDTKRRLDMLWARIGDLRSGRLILEDLNTLYDREVITSASRIVGALRGRAIAAVITCYERPSRETLANIGIANRSDVQCTYFTREESCRLVQEYGGDPAKWGLIAHVLGGYGHPQLVHAYVSGASDRGWRDADAQNVPRLEGPTADVAEVRRDARRRLVERMPRETRVLLYRLSVSTVHFSRSTAMAVGSVPTEISDVGERFDALVGSWLEPAGRDIFRVSALASDFGLQMLTGGEQRQVHRTIAVETMQKRQLILGDVRGILMHAIAGESEQSLVSLAWAILSTKGSTRVALAENLWTLRTWPAEKPIYARSASAAAMLRMAQVRVCIACGERSSLTGVVAALMREIGAVDKPQMRHALSAHSLANLLATSGIANDLENWISLLSCAKRAAEDNPIFASVARAVEAEAKLGEGEFLRPLFAIGSTNITSVARLERILAEMDELDATERAMWLRPMDEASSDYSVLVGGAWVAEDAESRLDRRDAAQRYRRMAERTRRWGVPRLSLQCSVAQAVLLDQIGGLKEEALAVLDDAEERTARDLLVTRARAGLHYRHGEYRRALELFPEVLAGVTPGNPIERTLVFREAAISAGHCGRWREAEDWFVEAQTGARSAGTRDMSVIAVALEADAAGAALMSGNVEGAIRRFAKALEDVDSGEMPETLRAAYCQRVVRHAVMWCKAVVSGGDFRGADGQPLEFPPGTCSNLTPMSEIREHPLVPSDNAWYMLAQAEAEGGVDAGIAKTLNGRLSGGPIPALEAGLRSYEMAAHIDRLDADGVSAHLMSYLEGAIYLLNNRERLDSTWDPMQPERGEIPALSDDASQDSIVQTGARRCLLAYAVRALCAERAEAIDVLDRALEERFRIGAAGGSMLVELRTREVGRGGFERAMVAAIETLRAPGRPRPETFWGASLCLVVWVDKSEFRRSLTKRLAGWLRREWTRIVEEESFRLVRPQLTIPEVERVLRIPEDSRMFVLQLLNSTLEAADVTDRREYRRMIQEMMEE